METLRMCSAGAEEYMSLGKIKVLDKGYIQLVDYAGVDETVVAAARQSYDKGMNQDDMTGNERLINFLMREWHTSPFEQPMMSFEVKAPIMVFREWHRHRLARLNEMSGRYTELPEEYYIPEQARVQANSKTNKQGSSEYIGDEKADKFIASLVNSCAGSFKMYREALDDGIAKELARLALPVNTYSKMVWQSDLRNILGFLKLRTSLKAQFEIRMFANQMAMMVKASYPKVWEAFDEYNLNAMSFSKSELQILDMILLHYDGYGVGNTLVEKISKKLDSRHTYIF
ncbi:MAG: FAD-dependent thymidylate synthase [Janthinobacterium lividum]